MKQLDLFEWAAKRPTAKVIDFLPHLVDYLWYQTMPRPKQDGRVIPIRKDVA